MPSHYDTLGVSPTASTEDIRRAYHAKARRWHPDHAATASPADAGRAEDAMRRINEAWRVLGDPQRRRDYDRSLAPGAASGATTGSAAWTAGSGASTRIDPRLLDPEYLAARRDLHFQQIDRRHAVVLRMIPLLGFVVLLVAIVIVTAYARPRFQDVGPPATVPGPSIGVSAGTCVRIGSGPSLLPVPCQGVHDGTVVGARLDEPEARCPPGSVQEVALPNGAIVCLAP